MTDMKFSTKLECLIERRGLLNADVSRATGLPESRISEWTRGKGKLLAKHLETGLKLARVLGVTLDYLADEAAEHEPDASPSQWEVKVREQAGVVGWEEIWRRVLRAAPSGASPAPPAQAPGDGHRRVDFVVDEGDGPGRGRSVQPKRPGGVG